MEKQSRAMEIDDESENIIMKARKWYEIDSSQHVAFKPANYSLHIMPEAFLHMPYKINLL